MFSVHRVILSFSLLFYSTSKNCLIHLPNSGVHRLRLLITIITSYYKRVRHVLVSVIFQINARSPVDWILILHPLSHLLRWLLPRDTPNFSPLPTPAVFGGYRLKEVIEHVKKEKNLNFPFGLYLINVYLQTEKIPVLEIFKCFFLIIQVKVWYFWILNAHQAFAMKI